MTPRVIAAVLGAACICAFAAGAWGEEGSSKDVHSLQTNLELLEKLVRDAVDESLDRAPLSPDDVVHIKTVGRHRLAWIVEDYLSARLSTDVAAVYVAVRAAGPSEGGPRRVPGADGSALDTSGLSAEDTAPSDDKGARWEQDSAWGESASEPSSTSQEEEEEAGQETPRGSDEASKPGEQTSQAEQEAAAAVGDTLHPVEETPQAQDEEQPGEGAPQTGVVLEYRVTELEVTYPRRWRSSLFGSEMVERSARAGITFRMLDKLSGRVLWADSGRAAATDVVPQKLLAYLEVVEEGGRPAKPDVGGLGRVVEPIVVSGIVIGLVFLFYSSRT